MPNKTIYVKDEDLPLWDKAIKDEESLSSRFAAFLRFEENIRNHRPQITIMEPHLTLRDQFAMAAMQADAVQSAIIAAAYIAQGKTTQVATMIDQATLREYYATADAMLEARK
jgi:hypothetical protein